MASATATYQPRTTERGVLHSVVREHLETFLAEAARAADGAHLPEFVEHEFRDFLTCGVLAHGFARVRCDTCAFERLVPFSCKGRGFCPSCGGRRMTERAAHLVTEVLPRAPVRQWVLSLPYRLRYQLAWDHELCRAVLGVFARTLLDFYRRRGTADGRTGTLTVIQRFGGGLNLNVHFHTLALDGVFTEPVPGGPLVFLVHRVEQEQASVRALQTRHLFPLEDTQPARRRAVEVGLHRRRDRARAEERLARVAVGEARVRQIHPARRVEPAGRGGR